MKPYNDIRKIEQILKDLYKSAKEQNIKLNTSMVYQYLIFYDVPAKSRNKKVSNRYNPDVRCDEDFFSKWIDRFKDIKDIDVLVSDNWKYFCQFNNGRVRRDCVKMYIPLDYDYLYEGASRIFSYLAANNISHNSKIGSAIRFDNVVVRLDSLEDAMRLQRDVLDVDPVIRKGLIKTNSFAFSNNGIGYSYDGMLSYNSYLASLISEYINVSVNANNPNVGIDNFYNYVDRVSKSFDSIKSFLELRDRNDEKIVDACLVVELIKKSLKTNDMEEYYNFINLVQNTDVRLQVINGINSNKDDLINKNVNPKESLFKEMILVTMKKYPKSLKGISNEYDGMDYIKGFLAGNINSVTRDNNLRNKVREVGLSYEEVYQFVEDSGLVGKDFSDRLDDYIKKVMLEDIIENVRNRASEKDPNCDRDFVASSQIDGYIEENRCDYITRNGGARDLTKSFSALEVRIFLNKYGFGNIAQYMKSNINDKGMVRR